MNRPFPITFATVALLALWGCVNPPAIVIVDRATALEQQAAGSFGQPEQKLDRLAAAPRPVPLSSEQLQALGVRRAPLVHEGDLTDADRVDGLLVQHCIGEGKDGLLVDTSKECRGVDDDQEAQILVERVNRARRQLWRWMHAQREDLSEVDLERTWRQRHLGNVVCGGWVEGNDGKWAEKAC